MDVADLSVVQPEGMTDGWKTEIRETGLWESTTVFRTTHPTQLEGTFGVTRLVVLGDSVFDLGTPSGVRSLLRVPGEIQTIEVCDTTVIVDLDAPMASLVVPVPDPQGRMGFVRISGDIQPTGLDAILDQLIDVALTLKSSDGQLVLNCDPPIDRQSVIDAIQIPPQAVPDEPEFTLPDRPYAAFNPQAASEIEIAITVFQDDIADGDETEELQVPASLPFLHKVKDDYHIWVARVSLVTGQIQDWPSTGRGFTVLLKVADLGTYRLLNDDGEIVAEIVDSYVPNGVVPGRFGDYIDLEIDQEGLILNWPTDLDFEEFELFEP